MLTLHELHSLLRDEWLSRRDDELEEARSSRRKGRPKTAKEMKLEEIKLRETEEYRTGFGAFLATLDDVLLNLARAEVPDLTHPDNVDLFRRWDQKELGFVQLLRTIRVFRDEPQISVLSKPGRHHTLIVDEASTQSQ